MVAALGSLFRVVRVTAHIIAVRRAITAARANPLPLAPRMASADPAFRPFPRARDRMIPASATPTPMPTVRDVARIPAAIPCRDPGAAPMSILLLGGTKIPTPAPAISTPAIKPTIEIGRPARRERGYG